VPLAKNLHKEKQLMYVCTLCKNKLRGTESFYKIGRGETSAVFGFQEDCTPVSYYLRNKMVLVLSAMRHCDAVDEETGDHKDPEMIALYNVTNVGVELLYQLCQESDVAHNRRHWPMLFNVI
jgi:hypothetical protein